MEIFNYGELEDYGTFIASFIRSGINGNSCVFLVLIIISFYIASFIRSGINGNLLNKQ